MSKSIIKKLLALAISVLMIAMSTVYAFAVETDVMETEAEKSIQWLDDTITLKNNQIYFTTYNLTDNHQWGAEFRYNDDKDKIRTMFRDCIDTPQLVNTDVGQKYSLYTVSASSAGGSQTYSFDSTGGTYRKVRVKLSDISDYFNEDGSHTTSRHTFHFGDDEVVGENTYSSGLAIVSGCVVNGVAPDENGYVEIYISTKIGEKSRYYTDFGWSTSTSIGGGGGTNGGGLNELILGAVNGYYSVYISDATKVQMYAAKLGTLTEDEMFRADVDLDGRINVLDATKIQLYVAGYGC